MVEIKIVGHEENLNGLVDLFNLVFNGKASEKYWSWKYLKNPFAGYDPQVIVAVEDEKIIGARPAMDFEMWMNEQKVRVAQPCDTMVHPDYRRRGINSKMLEFSINWYKENGYAFFYSFPNFKAFPANIKHGWRVIGGRELVFYPVNAEKLVSRVINNKTLARTGGYLYKIFSGSEPRIKKQKYHLESYAEYNDKLSNLEDFVDKSKINLVRNAEFFKWRLDQHPNHNYEYVLATKDDEVKGYMVISKQITATGITEGKLIDFLIKNEDLGCFKELVIKSMDRLSDCDIISIWVFNQPKYRKELLSNLNFKSTHSFPYNRLRDESKFVARKLDSNKTELDIYDRENWQLSLIYPDTT
jgi:GNAT superfamily N-acetyltransferase